MIMVPAMVIVGTLPITSANHPKTREPIRSPNILCANVGNQMQVRNLISSIQNTKLVNNRKMIM